MFKSKNLIFVWVILFLFIWGFVFYYTIGFLTRGSSIKALLLNSIYYIGLFVFITFIIKFIEKKDFKDFGFTFNKIIKQLVLGILFAIVLILLTSIVFNFILNYDGSYNNTKLPVIIIVSQFIYMVFAGVIEELIFRGYLFSKCILIFKSKYYTIFISSIIFGFWHYPTNPGYMLTILITFFIGIFFSILRVKFKENMILALAICHILYNFYNFLYY